MFEAQKLESLRPSLPVPQPRDGREATEEYAPSLVLGQLQPKVRKPLPHFHLKAVYVLSELESRHEVISETHQIRLTPTSRFDLLFKPQVEQEVKIDVTQHWRGYSLDTKTNFQFERRITRWRGKSLVDLRRKEYYSYVTWRDPRKRRRRKD